MKNKVVVFGGSGFLGSHVADELAKRGYETVIFDIRPYARLKPGQTMMIGDINDAGAVTSAMEGASTVYNFSAVSDLEKAAADPMETVKVNILGNANLLDCARKCKVGRFVFASSIYVYGAYGSFYRVSKHSSELLIESFHEEYGLDYTILRYGSLYGKHADGNNWIHRVLKEALQTGKIVREGDGEEIREYIHVADAARSSADILAPEFANQCVIITGHHPMKIKDLLVMIREILNNKVEIEYVAPRKQSIHYEITPYSFTPKMGRKLSSNLYIDLGQGILECLHEIHRSMNGGPEGEGDGDA